MSLSRRGFLGFTAALVPIHQAATSHPPDAERGQVGGTLYLGTYGAGIGIATYDADGKLTRRERSTA